MRLRDDERARDRRCPGSRRPTAARRRGRRAPVRATRRSAAARARRRSPRCRSAAAAARATAISGTPAPAWRSRRRNARDRARRDRVRRQHRLRRDEAEQIGHEKEAAARHRAGVSTGNPAGAQHAGQPDQRQADQRGGIVAVDALEQRDAERLGADAAGAIVGSFRGEDRRRSRPRSGTGTCCGRRRARSGIVPSPRRAARAPCERRRSCPTARRAARPRARDCPACRPAVRRNRRPDPSR